MVCNFFAILTDETVRKINLTQNITQSIADVFILNSKQILDTDTDEILFDGNYKVDEGEVLYVNLILPDNVIEAATNSIGIPVLNLNTESVKALFWYESGTYYFQNFDKRKLLNNKNVITYDNQTYSKLENNAFIVENVVNAIYNDEKFYFTSYANANRIFSLTDFYEEASNEKIDDFATNDKVDFDLDWLKINANSIIRKQITLLQKSRTLENSDTNKIKNSAKKFKLTIDLEDGKIKFPNDKTQLKNLLTFLNEQYYIGLITGNKYKTNSKRTA